MSATMVDPEREPGQEEFPLTPVPLKSELGRDSTMGEEESGFASPDGSDCTHHETHVSAPVASIGTFASVSAAKAKKVEVEGQQSPQVVKGERESVTTEMQALIASLCTLDDEVRHRLTERSDPTCCSVENGPEEMNGERPLPMRTKCLGREANEGEEERKAVDDVDEISFDASVQRSLEKHPDSSIPCSEQKMNVCKGEIELQIAILSAPLPAHESGDGVTEVARQTGCETEEREEDGAMQSHFQQPAMSSVSLPNSGSEQKRPTDAAVAKAVAELYKSQETYDQAYMDFTQLQLQLQTLCLQKIEPPAQVLQVLHQLEQ
uniref:Uncharacterized protein n=1 Tax=Chromera velia CCMP2878 TaxID=1169474 RepID=A0A0G4I092_9ALVE|eukprot:Cvel_9890.t1-p1 / transcript=Cvel_9890.t1 / gene=Cvel_9890 / organism=Chromera_velia_CCMP2878 / gene_product=hypothetical protein / transcript_product=hypothetical protein / location=Cvel_scaffold583:67645-68604(+) / protein_length=320 / sequence_SO=supercontig / SO=protein_coding / is_pseudo=false